MGFFDWLSLGLDWCPYIGEVKAVLELFTGKDLITKEDLDSFDKVTCAISIIHVAGWLVKIPKISKAAKYTKKFEKFFTLVAKANKANDYVDKFYTIRLLMEESGCDTSNKKLDLDPTKLPGFDKMPESFKAKVLEAYIQSKNPPQSQNELQRPRPMEKSVGQLADEVIRGIWGNGEDRKRRLEEAGYNYQEVQNEVNRRLKK